MSIMTGAPVPDGADAIVPHEWTEAAGDNRIRVDRPVDVGRYVRPAGEDVSTGDILVRRGDTVTPALRGLFAGFDDLAGANEELARFFELVVRDQFPDLLFQVAVGGDGALPVDRIQPANFIGQ